MTKFMALFSGLAVSSAVANAAAFVVLVDISTSYSPEKTYCGAGPMVLQELIDLSEKADGHPIDIVLRTVGALRERPLIQRTLAVGTGPRAAKRVGAMTQRWLCGLAGEVQAGRLTPARETALYAALDEVAREDLAPAGGGTLVMITDGINHTPLVKGESALAQGRVPRFPATPPLKGVKVVALGLGRGVPEKLLTPFDAAWAEFFSRAGAASLISRRNY